MNKPIPAYNPATICDLYQSVRSIVDQIGAMRPLPYGQFATDSDLNRDIVRRHRALLAQAGALKGELYDLVGETASLAIESRAG